MTSKFQIPDAVLERSAKNIENGGRGLILFEGTYAMYDRAEREWMRTLTRREMSFVHELKVVFDAEMIA